MADRSCTSSTVTVASDGSATFLEPNITNTSSGFLIVPTENRTISFYGSKNLCTQDYQKQFPEFILFKVHINVLYN